MPKIYIQLFGRLCVRWDEQVIAGLDACKMQELLGYLLLHRQHPLSREALASLLWPETTTAQSKKKLRQLLWHLQSTLCSQGGAPHDRLFLVEPDQVQMNTEADLWLDVAVFEKTFTCMQGIAGQELDTQNAQAVQNAVLLYRGPLLEGCYEDWCLYQRERFQNMYLTMLEKLMGYCEVLHDYDTGIGYGMRIINCDKVRERTYRRLMRLHYLNGDRAKALGLYEQCSVALDEELGVKPSKRTMTFYKQILTEQLIVPEPTFLPTEAQPAFESLNVPLIETLDHLTQLQEFLTGLQSRIQQSKQKVERALNRNSSPLWKTDEGKDA
jgi:DNA-binding SARP family transcriptional activator